MLLSDDDRKICDFNFIKHYYESAPSIVDTCKQSFLRAKRILYPDSVDDVKDILCYSDTTTHSSKLMTSLNKSLLHRVCGQPCDEQKCQQPKKRNGTASKIRKYKETIQGCT